MIILHHEKETDFSNNGYGSLDNHIISPEVFWEMNGEFKLSFEYPMFGADEHITQNLVNRQIILSPVPYMDDQAFRIYRTQENLGYIYIEARHIFYDLLDNLIEDTNVVDKDGLGALSQLLGATQYPHNFKAFSNITKRTNMRTVRYNPVSAIMNDAENNTFINRWGGEILRDNFNIHMRTRLGSDKGVQIEHKKDLLGYEAVIDESTMATRIMPIGFDGLRLPEKYIDSPLLDPDSPKIRIVRYQDVIAAVGEYADREEAIPLEQAYAELRRLAQEEFTVHHVDEPETVIKVDFVTLENTKEYEEFKELQETHQGDTVRVIVPEQDFEVTSRLVAFTSNPLLKNHYLTTTLGNHVLEYTTSRTEINILRREIKSTNELVNVAIQAANGKNSNYWGTVDPNDIELNPQLEDTYFQEDGDYFAIWEFVEENGERYWRKGPNSDFGKELSNQIADVISDVESTREMAENAIDEIDGALQGSGKITLADLIASKITEDDFETLFFQQSDSVGFTYNEDGVRKAIIAIVDGTPYIKGEHVILDGDTVVNGDFKVSGDMLANGAVIQQLEADGIDAQDVNIINLNASNISGGNLELAKGLKITHNGKVIFGVNADNILNMDEDIKEELKGEDGKDTYELALENGFVGSMEDWLESLKGATGDDGQPTYTWVKYADTPTSGMDDFPDGKKYIGLAFNQTTATESTSYSAYQWSLMPQNIEIGGRNLFSLSRVKRYHGGVLRDDYNTTFPNIEDNRLIVNTRPGSSFPGQRVDSSLDKRFNISGKCSSNNQMILYINEFDENDNVLIEQYSQPIIPSNNRYSKSFEVNSNTTHFNLGIGYAGNDWWISVKLEKGNIATDWTEAPEDTQARLDDKVDRENLGDYVAVEGYQEEIGEINTSLRSYMSMLEQSQTDIYGLYELDENGNPTETLITDDDGEIINAGVIAEISDLLSRSTVIENNLGEFTSTWQFLETKIIMGNEGMLVGEYEFQYNSDTEEEEPVLTSGIMIGSDRIDFVNGNHEEPVAFITGNVLQINHGIFVKTLQVGEHKIETILGGHTIWQWVDPNN